ncbi:hypothetical protein HYQ44_003163 [Verticillium longisporum]|nr:hypothetical protein HYQ44_003163 [Verticillium longisporum]
MEDSSAPKRRRTSPRTSIPIRTADRANSSSAAENPTSQPARRRPSFASPTKASLARTNPDILRRRSTQQTNEDASPPRAVEPGAEPSELSNRDMTTAQEPRPPSQSERASGGTRAKDGGLRDRLAQRAEQQNSPAQDTEPASMGSPARRPPRNGAGQLRAKPRRSPVKPNPRPLPPPDPEDEDFDPFARRGLNRTPPPGSQPAAHEPTDPMDPTRDPESSQARQLGELQTGSEIPEPEEPEEPEIPPTPTQKGLEDPIVTTPPTGIHNTPSKRSGRRRSDRGMKSSPLKQPPMRPSDTGAPSKKRRQGKAAVPFVFEGEEDAAAGDEAAKPDDGTGTHFARRVPPLDPYGEQRAQRDKLQAEIAQLQADLELATAGNERERVRVQQSARRSSKQPQSSSNQEELLDMLSRHLLPAEQTAPAPDASQPLFDLAMDPTSWFTLASPALPLTLTAESESTPISHHPIQMTAAEELPYLQIFTPFSISQTTAILPREDPSSPLLRQHTINVSSSPPGLFGARIELVANTSTLRVDSLSVPALDPSAVPELGPWIATLCDRAANTATDRNVTLLNWSMAEWHRIALQRAHFWALLAAETSDPQTLLENARELRQRRRKKRRRDDEDEDLEGDALKRPSRTDLIAHMGRTSFDVSIPDDSVDEAHWPRLRVSWKIHFDWTGEGQSTVGVLAGLPGKWHNADDSKALNGLHKVFGDMVRKEETPMNAVRTVVALLAGDGGR